MLNFIGLNRAALFYMQPCSYECQALEEKMDKTMDDKFVFFSSIMINKITPSEDCNYWFKRLDFTSLLNQT